MDERQPTEISSLVADIEKLRRSRDGDRALLEQLQIALITGPTQQPATQIYPDWVTWVDEWLTPRISRSEHRYRWCHQYAEHPEVADRLEALWHAWETTWPHPDQRISWYRDGLDHQLAVITADAGPLRDCSSWENEHRRAAPLAG